MIILKTPFCKILTQNVLIIPLNYFLFKLPLGTNRLLHIMAKLDNSGPIVMGTPCNRFAWDGFLISIGCSGRKCRWNAERTQAWFDVRGFDGRCPPRLSAYTRSTSYPLVAEVQCGKVMLCGGRPRTAYVNRLIGATK